MPTYAYKCESCETKYEVFFKVKEEQEQIVCPSCNSAVHKKLMSATNIGGFSSRSDSMPTMPPCANGGGCSPGMCNLN